MTITLIGNKEGIYIDSTNCNAYMDYEKAVNIQEVNFSGVNNLVINREKDGSFKIIQAGGYDSERGLFVDLY